MTTDFTRPKAFSYLRFSRPEQARGDSLRRQLQAAHDYALKNALELDDTLRDEGKSAFRSKNLDEKAALGKFLKRVEDGYVPKGSFLLVESLDRLSRDDVPVALRLFLTILEHGITIVTLMDNKRYSSESISAVPTDLIISITFMMRSNDESSHKSRRVRDAWANKRLKAEKSNAPMTSICPGWLELVSGRYQEAGRRGDVVRRIFQMCIDGYGTRAIAKTLNVEKEPLWGKGKKRGRFWHDSYIKKILENPAVYGEYTPKSKRAGGSDLTATTPILGYFPVVVARDVFNRARAMLKTKASSNVRSSLGKHRNILSGIVKCAECGGGMHHIDKGPKGGLPHLACGSSRLSGGCSHKTTYIYTDVEAEVLLSCSQVVTRAANDKNLELLASEEAHAEVSLRLERVADAIEHLGLSDTLQSRFKAIEKEKKIAEAALVKARNAADRQIFAHTFRAKMKTAAELISRLNEESENTELRAEVASMLLTVLERIELKPRRCTLYFSDGITISGTLRDGGPNLRRWISGPSRDVETSGSKRTSPPPVFTPEDFARIDEEIALDENPEG